MEGKTIALTRFFLSRIFLAKNAFAPIYSLMLHYQQYLHDLQVSGHCNGNAHPPQLDQCFHQFASGVFPESINCYIPKYVL